MPRHDLDSVSLMTGLAFAGAGFVFLIDRETAISGRWVWPLLLIIVGVAGLLATTRTTRTNRTIPTSPTSREASNETFPPTLNR